MSVKDKISLKRIPVFLSRDQAMTDMGVLHTKILLRPDEVAAILRVSLSQVYEMIHDGYLEATGTRPKRIKSDSLKHHLKVIGALK
jgi:excisionase family DNA binding protein